MTTATGRMVASVCIDRTDASQTTLKRKDRIYDRHGRRIALEQIADAFNDASGWIDFDTEARTQSADDGDREPWQDAAPEVWQVARARIYARAVVEVMAIYDEDA